MALLAGRVDGGKLGFAVQLAFWRQHGLLDRLGPGNVLTVWKLDRLSRSLKDLLLILDKVERPAPAPARSPKTSTAQQHPAA